MEANEATDSVCVCVLCVAYKCLCFSGFVVQEKVLCSDSCTIISLGRLCSNTVRCTKKEQQPTAIHCRCFLKGRL